MLNVSRIGTKCVHVLTVNVESCNEPTEMIPVEAEGLFVFTVNSASAFQSSVSETYRDCVRFALTLSLSRFTLAAVEEVQHTK